MSDQPCQQICFKSNSAFIPIAKTDNLLSELEAHLSQCINEKKNIVLKQYTIQASRLEHPLIIILRDMTLSVFQDIFERVADQTDGLTGIHFEFFKAICYFVGNNAFITSCKYYQQLCSSMLFEESFIEIFRRCFIQTENNTQTIKFEHLDSIFMKLSANDYKTFFANELYRLCSGSFILIEQSSFMQTVKFILWTISKKFTDKTNFITRNLRNVKKSKTISEIVAYSVKLISNFKNEDLTRDEIMKVNQLIFGDKDRLKKEEFVQILLRLDKNHLSNSVWMYFDLLRVESLMLLDSGLKSKVIRQNEVDNSNFYAQEMQKLLNKCPYNGDQCCGCKKCQCVRRNRESAKISQQKKRSAVEQLNPLRKRVYELEQQNRHLEQQNKALRGIVSSMRNHPELKNLLAQTLEPISKLLQDQ